MTKQCSCKRDLQDLHGLERAMGDIINKYLMPNLWTRCLDCQTWGAAFPHDRQCGNCNSLNVCRYYPEGAILKLQEQKENFRDRGIDSLKYAVGGSIFYGYSLKDITSLKQKIADLEEAMKRIREETEVLR